MSVQKSGDDGRTFDVAIDAHDLKEGTYTAQIVVHAAGLPDCAGVALGFDRLVMSAFGLASIAETMAFPVDRA